MMSLRILKKRSKQAVPLLIAHYGRRAEDFFPAKRGENYHGLSVRCSHKPGRFKCDCHWHPLKGTPMTGEVSGYYEPEWDERTAYAELCHRVIWTGRAAAMTDQEWNGALRITRSKPVTEEELRQWTTETKGNENG